MFKLFMQQMFTFKKKYLIPTFLILAIEVIIALFIHDRFIRPFFGDFLVVVLIYSFLRMFLNNSPSIIAIGTLLFSFVVEFAQYFKVVEILGLKGNRLAEIIIGTSYSNLDLLAYLLGVLFAYFTDSYLIKCSLKQPQVNV